MSKISKQIGYFTCDVPKIKKKMQWSPSPISDIFNLIKI